jgi:hypothetical protein
MDMDMHEVMAHIQGVSFGDAGLLTSQGVNRVGGRGAAGRHE